MPKKPTYDELARSYWEYLAASNNDGDPVAPTEDEVAQAYAVLERTGVANPYENLFA